MGELSRAETLRRRGVMRRTFSLICDYGADEISLKNSQAQINKNREKNFLMRRPYEKLNYRVLPKGLGIQGPLEILKATASPISEVETVADSLVAISAVPKPDSRARPTAYSIARAASS